MILLNRTFKGPNSRGLYNLTSRISRHWSAEQSATIGEIVWAGRFRPHIVPKRFVTNNFFIWISPSGTVLHLFGKSVAVLWILKGLLKETQLNL